MAFRIEIDMQRSPQEVFEFLADGTKTPLWYEAVRSAEPLAPGPVAQGSRYTFVRDLPVGRVENLVEVSEFRAGEVVEFTSVEGPTPFTYRYRVQPAPRGARVILDGEISGEGLKGPIRLLSPLASQLFARGMEHNLQALRQLLEAESGAS